MKIKKTELANMIREAIQEQLEMPDIDPGMQDIEETFDYIREKLGEKDFIMAKRFVGSLKKQISEMELRSYGLKASYGDEE